MPAPRRVAQPGPAARRRAGERAKAPVKKAKSSYKPKTAGPRSVESPRLLELHAALDALVRVEWPNVEGIFDYGMHGWRAKRQADVAWTVGTVDPAFVTMMVAERAAGVTLHLWNPLEAGFLARRRARLAKAGFKVMVGCLQWNRKAPFPTDVVAGLVREVGVAMRAEA